METLLKRHFWVVTLLGLGCIAWLTAGSISAFVGMMLAKESGGTDAPAIAAAAEEMRLAKRLRESRLREESGAIMTGRSPFLVPEPAVEPEPFEEEVVEVEPEPEIIADPSYEPTSLPIKLLGTMVVSPESWSSASVEAEREQKIVTTGVELLNGQATVLAIRRNYIVLKESTKITIAPLYDLGQGGKDTAATRTPTSTVMPAVRPSAPAAATTASAGVRKIAEGAFQLDRNHINDKLQNLARLGQEVRIVPNYNKGKYEGFKMIGMQSSSLFKSIGFDNGDIVQSINGDRIDSPNKALALYEALKNKSRLTVLIERDGIAKTLRYTIR